MFAFLLAAGAHLHLAGPQDSRHVRIRHALVAACASVPLTFAFRAALLSALGLPHRHELASISRIAPVAAMAVGAVVLAAERVIRPRQHPAQHLGHGGSEDAGHR
jgi:hypothetical protein